MAKLAVTAAVIVSLRDAERRVFMGVAKVTRLTNYGAIMGLVRRKSTPFLAFLGRPGSRERNHPDVRHEGACRNRAQNRCQRGMDVLCGHRPADVVIRKSAELVLTWHLGLGQNEEVGE